MSRKLEDEVPKIRNKSKVKSKPAKTNAYKFGSLKKKRYRTDDYSSSLRKKER